MFLLCEAGLGVFGFGTSSSFFIPVKINDQSVWIENSRFGHLFFGRDIARKPFPLVMPKEKQPGTVRVFVFGESAAYGDPLPDFGLSRMLETVLSQRHPNIRFEVINTAMTAINSHVILPIAKDSADKDGDVWMFYMGNNEVVGPYGSGTVFGPAKGRIGFVRASIAAHFTRIGQLVMQVNQSQLKTNANSQEWAGMKMFLEHQVRHDDPDLERVYGNFNANLKDLIQLGQRQGVKVVISSVASNLKDCAPFASLHRKGISQADLSLWEDHFKQGLALRTHAPAKALEAFAQAAVIDDQFAELQYQRGQCCLSLGRNEEAKKFLTLARDLDTLRFRADTRINSLIRSNAEALSSQNLAYLDFQELLGQLSPHGVPGEEFLYEHVHLNFEGNYLLAQALATRLESIMPSLATNATAHPWPTKEVCSKHLVWNAWKQYEVLNLLNSRFEDPPFNEQSDHLERDNRLHVQIQNLLREVQPVAMRQYVTDYSKALETAPNDWVLHKNQSILCEQIGNLELAAKSAERVTQLVPHCLEGWQELGIIRAQQNDETGAVKAFQQALKLDSHATAALTGIAMCYERQEKNSEALQLYKQALRYKPYWGPAHAGLGRLLKKTGDMAGAETQFRQSIQNRLKTPSALAEQGKLCYEQGWYSEAVTYFQNSLKLNPSDAYTYVNLGLAYAALQHYPEAMESYSRAVTLDPQLPEAHFRLGFEYGRKGDDKTARQFFSKAIELKPGLTEAHLDLGIALLRLGLKEEALTQFQDVVQRDPTNTLAFRYVQSLKK